MGCAFAVPPCHALCQCLLYSGSRPQRLELPSAGQYCSLCVLSMASRCYGNAIGPRFSLQRRVCLQWTMLIVYITRSDEAVDCG